ncbi:MAG: DUF2130 domain-containing protein [Sulfuriferula sp.]|nr:DUF2130 domain-containing protein [Sulfuriferula sp.]
MIEQQIELTSLKFSHRVEAIVEAFSSMQKDLDRERKVIMKQWTKRGELIEQVAGVMVSMYGDLQEIEGVELPDLGVYSSLTMERS